MRAKIVTAFLVGLVIGGGVIGTLAYWKIQSIPTPTKPTYSDAVQWMIDHQAYSERIKKTYDTYMKAAESAFSDSLTSTTSNPK